MKRLLLADRSLTTRRVVELTFKDEDIEVLAVGSAAKAIQAVAANPPDVVLADAALPPPGAQELASFIKRTAALAHIPVVLLTAAFQPVDDRLTASGNCDAILVRPLDRVELAWRVKELLRPQPPAEPVVTPEAGNSVDSADTSLEDRFDAVDAALEDGTALAMLSAAAAALHAPDDQWLSVDDHFERADEEVRRRSSGTWQAALTPDERAKALDSLKRAFLDLLAKADDGGHGSAGDPRR